MHNRRHNIFPANHLVLTVSPLVWHLQPTGLAFSSIFVVVDSNTVGSEIVVGHSSGCVHNMDHFG
jgi:hypothetical protein